MIKFLMLNNYEKIFNRRRIADYFIINLFNKNKDKFILLFKINHYFKEYYYITYKEEKILKINYKTIKNIILFKIKKEENTSFNL